MSIAIDIVLAVIIAIPIVLGIKRGLIKSVMGLVTVVLAVIAANVFMPYILPFTEEKIVQPYLAEPIGSYVESIYDSTVGEAMAEDSVLGQLPKALEEFCDALGIDVAELVSIGGEESGSEDDLGTELVDNITERATGKVAEIISFAAIFFASVVILIILTRILNTIFKLPVLNGINRVTGAIFGLICGGAMAFVLGNLLIAIMPALVSANPSLFEGSAERSIILSIIAAL